jgi:hypothetical protein
LGVVVIFVGVVVLVALSPAGAAGVPVGSPAPAGSPAPNPNLKIVSYKTCYQIRLYYYSSSKTCL